MRAFSQLRAFVAYELVSRCVLIVFVAHVCNYEMVAAKARFKTSECPPQELILPCRCLTRKDEYQIWCTHSELLQVVNGLKSIAKYIQDPIDELILENNNLPALPGSFFKPIKIMRLMLRNNNIQRVSSTWLSGLEDSLMEVFVVEPELRNLPIDSLDNLNRLEAITIKSFMLKRSPYFSGLPRLKHIHVESTSLAELPSRNYKLLPSLEHLHITNSDHLTKLEPSLLEDLPRLNLVNFSYCAIEWMHPRVMMNLENLTHLHLIGNQINDAAMVGRALRGLGRLEVLRLDYNNIGVLGEASFVDIPMLKELYLTNNRITEIRQGAFHRVTNLKILNLNNNLVRSVHPESFLQPSSSGLEELWLINNDISHVSELHSILEATPRLIFLDMSNNFLEDIPFGALRGHPTLERLHLNHNRIRTLERESFTAMPALRELRLRNNSLSNFLDAPFWNLPALKGLDLSLNYFKRTEPRLFGNLPSLRKVDLSENQITYVDMETFLDTPLLEQVNMSYNLLTGIHPATFRHLVNLYEVDANYNRLMEFIPGLPRRVEYLHVSNNNIVNLPITPSPDLDLPALRMLDLSANRLHGLPNGVFRSLLQLKRLVLSKNQLKVVDENTFLGLPRLEVLNLDVNQIKSIHSRGLRDKVDLKILDLKNNRIETLRPEVLGNNEQLKRLDVSRNLLTNIYSETFDNIPNLIEFDASYNFLTDVPVALNRLKHLKHIDLTNNRLNHLNSESLRSIDALTTLKLSKNQLQELDERSIYDLSNLRMLDLQENELQAIQPNAIYNLSKLITLKLSKNKLRQIPDNAIKEVPNLQILELQENNMEKIAENAFVHVNKLLLLNLSHNNFQSLNDANLKRFKSLEVLDLSHNSLNKIDSSMSKMEWLVELKLDHNRICTIDGTPFNGMPRLRVLSLKNNRLTSLMEYSVKRLRNNLATLDIDGNPLTCGCSLIWMKSWLYDTTDPGPRCSDGHHLREIDITYEDCQKNSKYNEPLSLAPGCENDYFEEKYATSQVLSHPGDKVDENILDKFKYKRPEKLEKPLPEESEYFYDEYIDYPYNDTNFVQLDQNNSLLKVDQNPETTENPTSKISSHFVSGDTPTIYAEAKNATLRPDNVQEDPGPIYSNNPSVSSGFTFFGMPLPALNLGSFWGSSRKADRKSSFFYPRHKVRHGHVQQEHKDTYSPSSSSLGNVHPMESGFKPYIPGVEDGFTPMESTRKGIIEEVRRPVVNESNVDIHRGPVRFVNETNTVTTTNTHDYFDNNVDNDGLSDYIDEVLNQTTISTVSSEVEANETNVLSNTLVVDKTAERYPVNNETSVKYEAETVDSTVNNPRYYKNPFAEYPDKPNDKEYEEATSSEEKLEGSQNRTNEVDEPYLPLKTPSPSENKKKSLRPEVFSNIPVNEAEVLAYHQKSSKDPDIKEVAQDIKHPTSLSALLVPGGLQPQQYKPNFARSTVEKVEKDKEKQPERNTTVESLISRYEELDVDSNIDGDIVHLQRDLERYEFTTMRPQQDEAMNWYFMNYNSTNVDPYVGPGAQIYDTIDVDSGGRSVGLDWISFGLGVVVYLWGS